MKRYNYLSNPIFHWFLFFILFFSSSISYSQGYGGFGQKTKDYDIVWQKTVGVTYDDANNSLTKILSDGWYNTKALSKNRLVRNQDGYVEYVVDNITDKKIFGLSTKNFTGKYSSIDYAFLKDQNKLTIIEHGEIKGSYDDIQKGDVLRIERKDDKILYLINSDELRKQNTNKNFELFVDLAIFTEEAVFSDLKSSFLGDIEINYTKKNVNPLLDDKNNGSINLDIEGGLPPYTISWNTGEETENISNLNVGEYTVTVTDNIGQTKTETITINYEYTVSWEAMGGVVSDTTDSSLTKTENESWKNSGALSSNILNRNENGYVEYTITDLTHSRAFGLSTKNYNWDYETIDYAFVQRKEKILIFEHGRIINNYEDLELGDVLHIERKNNEILYFINNKQIRRKNTNKNFELFVDVSIFENGSDIKGLKTSFSSRISLNYKKTDVNYLVKDNNGGIQLFISGGVPPFDIQWSTGQNAAFINNLTQGEYIVTVTDFLEQTVKKRINIDLILEWAPNSGLVINDDNSLRKITNNGWGIDGAAYSENGISPNDSGYFELKITNPYDFKAIGLSSAQVFNNVKNIDYTFYCINGSIYIYELGKLMGKYGSLKTGTYLKISKNQNQIIYFVNHKIVRKTNLRQSDLNLYVNTSLYQKDSRLEITSVSFRSPLDFDYLYDITMESIDKDVTVNPKGGYPPYEIVWENQTYYTLNDIQLMFDTIPLLDSLYTVDEYYNKYYKPLYSIQTKRLRKGIHTCTIIDSKGNQVTKTLKIGDKILSGYTINCSVNENGELSIVDENAETHFTILNELTSKRNTFIYCIPNLKEGSFIYLRETDQPSTENINEAFLTIKYVNDNEFVLYRQKGDQITKNTHVYPGDELYFKTDSINKRIYLYLNSELLFSDNIDDDDSFVTAYYTYPPPNNCNKGKYSTCIFKAILVPEIDDPWWNSSRLIPRIKYTISNPTNCTELANGTINFRGEITSERYYDGEIVSFKLFKKNGKNWDEITTNNFPLYTGLDFGTYKMSVDYEVSNGTESHINNLSVGIEIYDNITWVETKNMNGLERPLNERKDIYTPGKNTTYSIKDVEDNNDLASLFAGKMLEENQSGWIEFDLKMFGDEYSPQVEYYNKSVAYFGFTEYANRGPEFIKYGYKLVSIFIPGHRRDGVIGPWIPAYNSFDVYKIINGVATPVILDESDYIQTILGNKIRIERKENGDITLNKNDAFTINLSSDEKLYFQAGAYNKASFSNAKSTFPCEIDDLSKVCIPLVFKNNKNKNYNINSAFGKVELNTTPDKEDEFIFSKNKLGNNENGYVKFKYRIGDLGKQIIGLVSGQKIAEKNYLDYAFVIEDDGVVKIFEKGNPIESYSDFGDNSILKIERKDGVIQFYNDDLLLRKTLSTSDAYYVALALNKPGTKLQGLKASCSFTFQVPILDYFTDNISSDWNTTSNLVYNEDAEIIGASRIFFDNFGRNIQSQSLNLEKNKVMGSQVVFDEKGRTVLNTLIAPVFYDNFQYQDKFITNENNENYNYHNFDGTWKYDPWDISTTCPLGKYYSNNNIEEPLVTQSSFPYSRVEYSELDENTVIKKTAAGENYKLGSGHEVKTYSMRAPNVLEFLFGLYEGYSVPEATVNHYEFNTETKEWEYVEIESDSKLVSRLDNQSITFDQDGKGAITFFDKNNNKVATATSGKPGAFQREVVLRPTLMPDGKTYQADLYLPVGIGEQEIAINSFEPELLIKNLETGENITPNSLSADRTHLNTKVTLPPGLYRIFAKGKIKFKVDYSDFTLYEYNKANQLVKIIPPNGIDQSYYQLDLNTVVEHTTRKVGSGFETNGDLITPSIDEGLKNIISIDIDATSSSTRKRYVGFSVDFKNRPKTRGAGGDGENSELDDGGGLGGSYQLNKLLREYGLNILVKITKYNNENVVGTTNQRFFKWIQNNQMEYYDGNKITYGPITVNFGELTRYVDWLNKNETNVNRIEVEILRIDQYYNTVTKYGGWELHKEFGDNYCSDNTKTIRYIKNYETDEEEQGCLEKFNGTSYLYGEDEYGDYKEYVIGSLYWPINGEDPYITKYYGKELLITAHYYDIIANDNTGIKPNHKMAETYTYNKQGLVKTHTSVDAGETKFVYRKDGKVRYSENELQRANGTFSYVNYDKMGRIVESGVFVGPQETPAETASRAANTVITSTGFETINNWEVAGDPSGTGESDNSELIFSQEENSTMAKSLEQTFNNGKTMEDVYGDNSTENEHYTLYDKADPEGISDLGLDADKDYKQYYIAGTVSKTWNNNSTTWYSYDDRGNTEWTIQKIPDLDAKTTHYEYDYLGHLSKNIYQKDVLEERLDHVYTYNKNGNLKDVKTYTYEDVLVDNDDEVTGDITSTHQTSYEYYTHGPVKRIEINKDEAGVPLQGIDYTYTINGKLKAINQPYLVNSMDPGHDANDLFGMSIDYYPGDYSREGLALGYSSDDALGNYNGNITAINWETNNSGNIIEEVRPCKTYKYQYNYKNWLIDAKFRSSGYGGEYSEDYHVSNITYDPNGNILTLKRNGYGIVQNMDNLTYNYIANTNKLRSIEDNAANSTVLNSIITQTEDNQYDVLGQMVFNKQDNFELTYTPDGLVKSAKKDDYTKYYTYDERGYKIYEEVKQKKTYSTSTVSKEWYVRDVSGNILSTYQEISGSMGSTEIKQIERPIYAAGRIGTYKNNSFIYEHTDHLGNVRLTYKRDSYASAETGNAQVLSNADYYPFGWEMPGRNKNVSDNKFGYQGQFAEKDPFTGYNSFQLRQWDSRTGRWMSIDPYGQFHSPYLGMGNNPIGRIDLDGGTSPDNVYLYSDLNRPTDVVLTNDPYDNIFVDGKFTQAQSWRGSWIGDNVNIYNNRRDFMNTFSNQSLARIMSRNSNYDMSTKQMAYNIHSQRFNQEVLNSPITKGIFALMLAPFAAEYIIANGIISMDGYLMKGGIDFATQTIVNGGRFWNNDYFDTFASAVTTPGVGRFLSATVDLSKPNGFQMVGGEKPFSNAVIEFGTSSAFGKLNSYSLKHTVTPLQNTNTSKGIINTLRINIEMPYNVGGGFTSNGLKNKYGKEK